MNTFGILAVIALASISIVPVAKPVPPTLTSQFFSQSVTFSAPWSNNLIAIPAPSTCFSGQGGLVSIGGLNFTENLSGRDAGSTWIQFNSGLGTDLELFKTADLTLSTLDQLACSYTPVFTIAQFSLLGTGPGHFVSTAWRVPASGSYTLVAECGCTSINAAAIAQGISAKETWTVTTIS